MSLGRAWCSPRRVACSEWSPSSKFPQPDLIETSRIMSRRSPRPSVLPNPRPDRKKPDVLSDDDGSDAEIAAWLGERLRRVALGLTAALMTARAFWPSEI